MYRNFYETEKDIYDICTGCVNLVKGTIGGIPYKCCGGGVGNPKSCVLYKDRQAKTKKVTSSIKKAIKGGRKMQKNIYAEKTRRIFAERLNTLMKKYNYDCWKLELKVNHAFKHAVINKWQNAKFLPKPKNLFKLAKALKTTPNYLLGYTDVEKRSIFDILLGLFK